MQSRPGFESRSRTSEARQTVRAFRSESHPGPALRIRWGLVGVEARIPARIWASFVCPPLIPCSRACMVMGMTQVEITDTLRFNNDQTMTTSSGQFMAVQRNAGYANNDGHWVIDQLPELYWSPSGTLRQRRPGKFLGVYATTEQAITAIEAAELQPVADKMIR